MYHAFADDVLALFLLPLGVVGVIFHVFLWGTLVGALELLLHNSRCSPTCFSMNRLAGQRPQRASARGLNAAGIGADTAAASGDGVAAMELPDGDHILMDTDAPVLSRSNSSPNVVEEIFAPPAASGRPQRKDKGKGKEKAVVRIKEEPMPVTLQQLPEPSSSHVSVSHIYESVQVLILGRS